MELIEHKSTSRYILVSLAIILVITAFALIALNALHLETSLGWNFAKIDASQAALDAKYKEGYLNARMKYLSLCPALDKQGNSISGTVESIKGDKITFIQNTFDSDETVDGVGDRRTATIGSAKIILSTKKDDATRIAEMAAFKPGNASTPPSALVDKETTAQSIKVGDAVVITARQELSKLASFDALTVQIMR